jgi:hypothetical protein
MFVFMAIKDVLLVFNLRVEVFIVLFKKVPVVFVDVKDRVEMLKKRGALSGCVEIVEI